MLDLKTFDVRIKYYKLIMIMDNLKNIDIPLPKGYHFEFFKNDKDIKDWIEIHISTGEFASFEDCRKTFYDFYSPFFAELDKRLFFIVDENNKKIATATLSPTENKDYPCVIDWFAVHKEFQGKKLSKPLLGKIIELAINFDYDKILLHTQTNSWLAAKIYLDFGFVPYNTNEKTGWNILKTITNHPKLSAFIAIKDNEIFDPLIVNIQKSLSKIYDKFYFTVWYINGRNDVYVHSDNNFYEYKFYDCGNKLVKIK